MSSQVQRLLLHFGNVFSTPIDVPIQERRYRQSCLRRGSSDQSQERLQIAKRMSKPIFCDRSEQALFDGVPRRCPVRIMTNRHRQVALIAGFLQRFFQSQVRQPLLPPESARIISRFTPLYKNMPRCFHQRRIAATASRRRACSDRLPCLVLMQCHTNKSTTRSTFFIQVSNKEEGNAIIFPFLAKSS